MSKINLIWILLLFVLFIQVVDAQVVRDETFIPVSAEFCESAEDGCLAACMTSMLASLNDPRIGTDPAEIFNGLKVGMKKYSDAYPYPTQVIINSAISFLMTRI